MAHSWGNLDSCELHPLCLNLVLHTRCYMQRRQVTIETAAKDAHHHDAEDSKGEEPGCARNGIIHARSNTCTMRLYRSHHGRRQGGNADRHPQAEHHHGWEIRAPIAALTSPAAWE